MSARMSVSVSASWNASLRHHAVPRRIRCERTLTLLSLHNARNITQTFKLWPVQCYRNITCNNVLTIHCVPIKTGYLWLRHNFVNFWLILIIFEKCSLVHCNTVLCRLLAPSSFVWLLYLAKIDHVVLPFQHWCKATCKSIVVKHVLCFFFIFQCLYYKKKHFCSLCRILIVYHVTYYFAISCCNVKSV